MTKSTGPVSPAATNTLAHEGLGGLTRLAVSNAGRAAIGHSAASAVHTCATVSAMGMLLAALLAVTLMRHHTQQ